jgi:hypothetical protein
MKNKRFFIFKVFALFCLCALVLASCGKATEAPEDVIQKFKEEATQINSADISTEVVVNGTDNQDTIDATANVGAKFNIKDPENKKADIKIALGGIMKTAEQSLDGNVDINIRTIGGKYYILLSKFESSSESMKAVQTVLGGYIGKWLHVVDEAIPESIRQVQKKDEATLAKEKQLKQLFIDTNLLTVTKEYGVETVNGQKVYHYGVQLNQDGVKEYIRKSAVIDGRELTDTEIEDASKISSYVTSAELWIGVKDYYLYKATANLIGPVTNKEANMTVAITAEGSDYNNDINVDVPSDAQEFNPIELLMAYSTAASATANGSEETGGAVEPQAVDTQPSASDTTEQPAPDTTGQPAG